MKKFTLILLLILIVGVGYSQNNKKVVFIYQSNKDTLIENTKEIIFNINKRNSFKHEKGKHEKKAVEYNSIKNDIISYEVFKKQNKGRKYPEYFSDYSFYIYVNENDTGECLYEVEKIWLVEDIIID